MQAFTLLLLATHFYIIIYKITFILCMFWLDKPYFLPEYRDTVDVIFILY